MRNSTQLYVQHRAGCGSQRWQQSSAPKELRMPAPNARTPPASRTTPNSTVYQYTCAAADRQTAAGVPFAVAIVVLGAVASRPRACTLRWPGVQHTGAKKAARPQSLSATGSNRPHTCLPTPMMPLCLPHSQPHQHLCEVPDLPVVCAKACLADGLYHVRKRGICKQRHMPCAWPCAACRAAHDGA